MSTYGRILNRVAMFLIGIIMIILVTACNMPQATKAIPINTSVPALAVAPEITSAVIENNCNIRLNYIDHMHENGTVFLRRSVGATEKYLDIDWADVHGEQAASFQDDGLPSGEYSYQIGFSNSTKVINGLKSKPVVIGAVCGNAPLVDKPARPKSIRVEVTGVGGCTARVWGDVASMNLEGIRVYRSTAGADFIKIAELTPAEWLGAPPASDWDAVRPYDDKDLRTGTYRYKESAFNKYSEVFSDPSADVVISNTLCDPKVEKIPTIPPILTVTATPLPLPAPQACTWEAAVNIFVLKGPGASVFRDITAVVMGTQFPIIGQSEDGQFWVVEVKPGLNGYVPKAERFSRTSGDCLNPTTIKDPPVPPTAIPVIKPTHIPQCSDGIDNDGDGSIDMRDSGCTSLSDNSEN